ncbi:MAG: Uma2 family endonuclease [Methylococcaceae bacterium]|nr:MAG: Uma2 family endonuclease [Methylococcaceae bacterium]
MPAQFKPLHRYTFEDYQRWPEDQRWEIIGGVAFNMCPAPSTRHQTVTGNFFSHLRVKLSGRRCRVFIAPTDVKFSDTDVVQPDVLVVCDPAKITPSHVEGAPDLVVEVLSPSTSAKDLREKKALYQRYGVREYLVIDPLENFVQRFLLGDDGGYAGAEIFAPQDTVRLVTPAGLEIALWEIFELPAPGTTPPAVGPTEFCG